MHNSTINHSIDLETASIDEISDWVVEAMMKAFVEANKHLFD